MVVAKGEEVKSAFYLRMTVRDEPGVLATISSLMARENISIARVVQQLEEDREGAPPQAPPPSSP